MSKDGTLPPGVEAYMIPGNRPEDEAYDKMIDNFFQHTHFTEAELKFVDLPEVVDLITKAIDYGITVGYNEQQLIDAENRYYEEQEKYHPNR